MGYYQTSNKTFSSYCTWSNSYEYKLSDLSWKDLNRNKIYHGHYFDPQPPYGWQGSLSYRRNHLGVVSFVGAFSKFNNDINKTIKSVRVHFKVDHAFLHAGGVKNLIIRGYNRNSWSKPGYEDSDHIDYDIKYWVASTPEGNSFYIDLNTPTINKIKNGTLHGFVFWSDDPKDYRVVVNTSPLNVRSGPGTGYSKIGSVGYGSYQMSHERKNGWHRITYDGKTGWISGDLTKYVKDSIYWDNTQYGYMYGSNDGSNAPRIEITYEESKYIETQCWGYGGQGCSCDSKCYQYAASACSCDTTAYNTCACDKKCYNYLPTCTCNEKQHGYIPCSCDQKCHTEGKLCTCDGKAFDEYYTCTACYNRCDGYTACQTCDGCNSYQACSCNGPCDRNSCDRCHFVNYGLFTEGCKTNIINYPVSKCPEDA